MGNCPFKNSSQTSKRGEIDSSEEKQSSESFDYHSFESSSSSSSSSSEDEVDEKESISRRRLRSSDIINFAASCSRQSSPIREEEELDGQDNANSSPSKRLRQDEIPAATGSAVASDTPENSACGASDRGRRRTSVENHSSNIKVNGKEKEEQEKEQEQHCACCNGNLVRLLPDKEGDTRVQRQNIFTGDVAEGIVIDVGFTDMHAAYLGPVYEEEEQDPSKWIEEEEDVAKGK